MIVTYTISNFCSNLQNHFAANKLIMKINKNKIILRLIQILIIEGFIRGYKLLNNNKVIVYLKNNKYKNNFNQIKVISTPSNRIYIKNTQLYKTNEFKTYIISTSKGFMTQFSAKKHNLGGELICWIN